MSEPKHLHSAVQVAAGLLGQSLAGIREFVGEASRNCMDCQDVFTESVDLCQLMALAKYLADSQRILSYDQNI